MPDEFPPELVKEGQEKELAPMGEFGVNGVEPLSQTTFEERRMG